MNRLRKPIGVWLLQTRYEWARDLCDNGDGRERFLLTQGRDLGFG